MCVVFYLYADNRDLHRLPHSFPTRRSSDLKPEAPAEGRLIGKAAGEGDLAESFLAIEHESLRLLDALPHDVAVGRLAETGFERAREVADAEPANGRKLLERDRRSQVLRYVRAQLLNLPEIGRASCRERVC